MQNRRANRLVGLASDTFVITALSEFWKKAGPWPFMANQSPIHGYKAQDYVNSICEKDIEDKDARQIGVYLAHLMLGHMFDGWRYLSKSLMSLANGDRSNAIHLAYYAELRAALSILASSGIGIINKHNFVIDKHGAIKWFGGETHHVTWGSLGAWASRVGTGELIYSLFSAEGLNGLEWAEVCNLGTKQFSDIPGNWVKEWAVDLKNITEDRQARNQASYNPNLSRRSFAALESKDLDLLVAIRRSTSAVASGTVRDVDRYIIWQMCLKHHQMGIRTLDQFWRAVERRLQTIKMHNQDEAKDMVRNLRQRPAGHLRSIFQYAKGPTGKRAAPHNIICRALLLLRLASALTRDRIGKSVALAGVSGAANWRDVLFQEFSYACNLASRGTPLHHLLSVSPAEQDAIAYVMLELSRTAGGTLDGHSVWHKLAGHIVELSKIEVLCTRAAT